MEARETIRYPICEVQIYYNRRKKGVQCKDMRLVFAKMEKIYGF